MLEEKKQETPAAKPAPRLRWVRPGLSSNPFLPIAVFVILFATFSIFANNFFKVTTALNLLVQTSTLIILAIGETLVLGVGGIDLSAEAVSAFGGIALAMFFNMGTPMWKAIILACMTCGVVGLANGFLVARFRLPSFIITLAMAMLVPGIASLFKDFVGFHAGSGSEYLGNVSSLPFAFRTVTLDASGAEIVLFPGISWTILIMVIVAVLSHLLLAKTDLGRYVYLVGSNQKSSLFSGINVAGIKIMAFVFSSMMAGLAGALITCQVSQPAGVTPGYQMIAIACAMIGGASISGGTGSVWRTVVGSLIIGTLTVGLQMTYWNQLYLPLFLNGLVLLAAVYLNQRQKRKQVEG